MAFRALSIELYGTVDRRLLDEAERILAEVRPDEPEGPWLGAEQIVRRADAELAALPGSAFPTSRPRCRSVGGPPV